MLSVELVVDTALRLARESDVDSVTLRQVGAELHTGQSSLYVWVPNRAALLQLMLSRALEDIRLPRPDPDSWQRQLVALVTRVHTALNRYPGLARVMIGSIPTDPSNMRLANCYLALMRVGGILDRAAAYAVDTLNLYVAASSLETSLPAPQAPQGLDRHDAGTAQHAFADLDPDTYPEIHRLAKQLAGGSLRVRFCFGLETIVTGLAAAGRSEDPGT
jgi:AcrR family transcriptional regulator